MAEGARGDEYAVTIEDEKIIAHLRKVFKSWQCAPCREGDESACTAHEGNARAYIEMPDGSRKHFCQIGCLLLRLSDRDMKALTLSAYDNHGDCLRNAGIPILEEPIRV